MSLKFAEFDVAEAVRRLAPARIFLRRRDPSLRRVLRAMLPEESFRFVEIADAALLLREVSGSVLSWERGGAVELCLADRAGDAGAPGRRDILVGCRRPAWNPGVLLLTALARDPDGDEAEYGSALVLGPGVSISLVPVGRPTSAGPLDAGVPAAALAGRIPLAS